MERRHEAGLAPRAFADGVSDQGYAAHAWNLFCASERRQIFKVDQSGPIHIACTPYGA